MCHIAYTKERSVSSEEVINVSSVSNVSLELVSCHFCKK